MTMVSVAVFATDTMTAALNTISTSLNAEMNKTQLIIVSLLITYGVLQIPCGLLADRYGRKPVIIAGLVAFLIGSVITIVADQIDTLLAGRVIQGIGSATSAVLSRAMARDLSSGAEFNRLMSTLIAATAFTAVVGPVLGGVVVSVLNWKALVILIGLVGLVALLLSLKLPETLPEKTSQSVMNQVKRSVGLYIRTPLTIWATALLAIHFFGFMTLLANFSLVTESVYSYSPIVTGAIFSTGVFIYFLTTLYSRSLTRHKSAIELLGMSMYCYILASIAMAWLYISGTDNFIFLCLGILPFMIAFGFVFSNTTTLSLQNIPHSRGFIAGLVGTFQISISSLGAYYSSLIYDGTAKAIILIIGCCSVLMILIYSLGILLLPEGRADAAKNT